MMKKKYVKPQGEVQFLYTNKFMEEANSDEDEWLGKERQDAPEDDNKSPIWGEDGKLW